MEEKEQELIFAVINNIPADYHSKDLRNFFSQFIEINGFECFHFRHRPESQKHLRHTPTNVGNTIDFSERSGKVGQIFPQLNKCANTQKKACCIVQLNVKKYEVLKSMYSKKHWLDKNGDSIPSLCVIRKVKVEADGKELNNKYVTRGERRKLLKDKEMFSKSDLEKLPELHPPVDVMPNGNVGTPTKVFLELIQQCKLPPGVIKKLGLSFPKTRSNRRYGNVPFDYGSSSAFDSDSDDLPRKESTVTEQVGTDTGQSIENKNKNTEISQTFKKTKIQVEAGMKIGDTVENSESEDDDDDCEEWERHEALQDDPTNVERNKERLFEEEIELKWEKGGSGLVFYTDAQYWKEQEGDFDEQTTDDWDVDMSVYYEENGGDKDARDLVTMRQEQRRRDGDEATDMRTAGFIRERHKPELEAKIGAFEKHTKGIGRKVLKRQGWTDGEGLGSTIRGIADAIDTEGQIPSDKRGIGYHGEKLDRSNQGPSYGKKPKKDFVISTVYDNPEETDPSEPLLRRNHHHHIKYRHGVQFHKALDPNPL